MTEQHEYKGPPRQDVDGHWRHEHEACLTCGTWDFPDHPEKLIHRVPGSLRRDWFRYCPFCGRRLAVIFNAHDCDLSDID